VAGNAEQIADGSEGYYYASGAKRACARAKRLMGNVNAPIVVLEAI
jgi:hypothetical protein